MFDKKLDRFSIRKLSVGAASVLIGISFLNLNTNQQVQAAENSDDSIKKVTKKEEAPAKEETLKVEPSLNSDAKVKLQAAQQTLKTQPADQKAETKKFEAPDAVYKVHIDTWDDLNNKPISYSRGDRIDGDFSGKTGTVIGNLLQPIAGYKLVNPQDVTNNFKLGKDGNYQIDGKDVNLTLHYVPLADIKLEYIDEDTNKVLASFIMLNSSSTVASPQYLAGDKTAPDASKYEGHAIDIPGYKLDTNATVEGKVSGQVQEKGNPNYVVVTFKYKKVTANADMELPDENKDVGAKINGGWQTLPGMFTTKGVSGITYEHDNGDVEKKSADLINKYLNQGFSYLGTNGKVYNKDYYNIYSTGTSIHLVPNKNVTVNYVDKNGKKLAASETISFNKDNPNQANNGVDPKNYWYAKGNWNAKAKEIDGYHLVETKGATSGKFTAYNYVVNFVYDKNDDVVKTESKTLIRTIHYVYEDGKPAAKDVVQPVTVTRTKTTTFDGKVSYSDWSSGDYDEVKSPEIKGYTPDRKLVSRETATKDENVTVTYKKNAAKVETETKTVTRTIHYVYADGKKASDDKTQIVTLTRTKTTDPVTDKISYSDWSKGTYEKVVSPEISGYTADKSEIEAIPATRDEVETVTYSAVPPQPQPIPDPDPIPQPQPEPTPTNPVEPNTPHTPDQPDIPAPHGQDVPTKPEPEVTETVKPHATQLTYGTAIRFVSTKDAKQEPVQTVAPHASELPKTGSQDDSAAALAGLALIGLSGLTGYTISKRRRG
ncbi:mucin-binding protein [uncultured Lactobacillus sp.]|uniref:mucin-binding protein n=1 Tax=uncultured Lactobacillus sp. TaxID=153152 RepID=UPI0026089F78|nr:MucBP domain-containing protein [uncultured Lactobacillus sp.]